MGDRTALAAERDRYLKSLHALLAKDVNIRPEDIAEMNEHGVDFGELVAEIETDLRSIRS